MRLPPQNTFKFDGFQVDPTKTSVRRESDEVSVNLTFTQFAILYRLVQAKGDALPLEHFSDVVTINRQKGSRQALETHVSRINAKFGKRVILGTPKRGYWLFTDKVENVSLSPKEKEPHVLSTSPLVSRLVEDYSQQPFAGRQQQITELNDFLKSQDYRTLLVCSAMGTGKTALLVHWALHVQQQSTWDILFFPVNQRYGTECEEVAFATLVKDLLFILGDGDLAPSYNALRDREHFASLLRKQNGRPLVLVIDGLDEAREWHLTASLFPSEHERQLKIVVTTRPTPGLTKESIAIQLGCDSRRIMEIIDLPALDQHAVSSLLQPIADPELALRVTRISGGDPLYLHYLVPPIKLGDMPLAELEAHPADFDAYLELCLSELDFVKNGRRAFALFALLCVAAGPLTLRDIDLLAPDIFESAREIRQAANGLKRFVRGKGTLEDGFVLEHPKLGEKFLWTDVYSNDVAKTRARFIKAGQRWWANVHDVDSPYFSQYWIDHLVTSGNFRAAEELVCFFHRDGETLKQSWLDFQLHERHSLDTYIRGLRVIAACAMEQQHVTGALRCILVDCIVSHLYSYACPELLCDMVSFGISGRRWNVSYALDVIKRELTESDHAIAVAELVKIAPKVTKRLLLDDPAVLITCCYSDLAPQILKALAPFPDEINTYVHKSILEKSTHDRESALAHVVLMLEGDQRQVLIDKITSRFGNASPEGVMSLLQNATAPVRTSVLTGLMNHCAAGAQTERMQRNLALAGLYAPRSVKDVFGTAIRTHTTNEVFRKYFSIIMGGQFDKSCALEQLSALVELGSPYIFDAPELTARLASDTELNLIENLANKCLRNENPQITLFLARIAPESLGAELGDLALRQLATHFTYDDADVVLPLIPEQTLERQWLPLLKICRHCGIEQFRVLIPRLPEKVLGSFVEFLHSGEMRDHGEHHVRRDLTGALTLASRRYAPPVRQKLLREALRVGETPLGRVAWDIDDLLIALLPHLNKQLYRRIQLFLQQESQALTAHVGPHLMRYLGKADQERLRSTIVQYIHGVDELEDRAEVVFDVYQITKDVFPELATNLAEGLPIHTDTLSVCAATAWHCSRDRKEQIFAYCKESAHIRYAAQVLASLRDDLPAKQLKESWRELADCVLKIPSQWEKLLRRGNVYGSRENGLNVVATTIEEVAVYAQGMWPTDVIRALRDLRPKVSSSYPGYAASLTPLLSEATADKMLYESDNPAERFLLSLALNARGRRRTVNWEEGLELCTPPSTHASLLLRELISKYHEWIPHRLVGELVKLAWDDQLLVSGCDRLAERLSGSNALLLLQELRSSRPRDLASEAALLARLGADDAQQQISRELQRSMLCEFARSHTQEYGDSSLALLCENLARIMPWILRMFDRTEICALGEIALDLAAYWR